MPDKKNYKILLLDDDRLLLNMYEKKFSAYGHEVLATLSSAEALSKLREGYNPDILILDVVMPHPDGVEVLKIIREEKLADSATVVMLTNQGASQDIEKAKQYGIDGYIIKAALIPSEVAIEVLKIAESKKR
ncbi:MAG: response regulator [Candidatus Paceibacterota bacterium]|nr:MAG: response regulator [Candidatus Paceibacterota bacterium]